MATELFILALALLYAYPQGVAKGELDVRLDHAVEAVSSQAWRGKRQTTPCNTNILGSGKIISPGNLDIMFCYWNCIPTPGSRARFQFWTFDLKKCLNNTHGFPRDYVGAWTGLTFNGPYCDMRQLPPSINFAGKITLIYNYGTRGQIATSIFTGGFISVPASDTSVCDYSEYLKAMDRCNVLGVSATGQYKCSSSSTATTALVTYISAPELPYLAGTFTILATDVSLSPYDPWFGFCKAGSAATVCGAGVSFVQNGYPSNGYTILVGNFGNLSSYASAPTSGVVCFSRPPPPAGMGNVVEKLPCISRVVASCMVLVYKKTDTVDLRGMSMYVSA